VAHLEEPVDKKPYQLEIVWKNVGLFAFLHLGSIYGLYLMLTGAVMWQTWIFTILLYFASGLGITAGAHRLWAHRSYKAKIPAKLILLLFDTLALQNDVIEWARDHRVHHKYSETDADPHNAKRGLFFSHMGWLLVRKHPEVKKRGAKLDLSDLFGDPILVFQRRYYLPLVLLICFLLPTATAVYGWNESVSVAFYTTALFRYCLTLHATWLINSAAHRFGYRPYDANISPVESLWTTFFALGEGGHNYHHTFPQDYRTSEYSLKLNWTRLVIDVFAALGWVYDRKVVADEIIGRQKAKHSHHHSH